MRLAVAMRTSFAALSETWARHGHTLELGIGIATGYATLGRIGFEGRYDYGAVGRVIIHAARLSADAAPGEILVASGTHAAIADRVVTSPAGDRQLKGFLRPLATFSVHGLADDGVPA